FINVADNDFLNFSGESLQGWGYCVFAEVVEGMDVVDKIKGVANPGLEEIAKNIQRVSLTGFYG
ncbi:peptidylprolyl isomerase, partial [Salmonella enterica subsp. enterica serovar Anatum]|nr:peptidylprolyl isomerase [Salmonella enterica subsp. enterica serovar Anatum]